MLFNYELLEYLTCPFVAHLTTDPVVGATLCAKMPTVRISMGVGEEVDASSQSCRTVTLEGEGGSTFSHAEWTCTHKCCNSIFALHLSQFTSSVACSFSTTSGVTQVITCGMDLHMGSTSCCCRCNPSDKSHT